MARDPELETMLRELSAMPASDRAEVLDQLGQAEREELRIILSASEEIALSPELSRLIDACRKGSAPPSLTERAAEALYACADEMAQQDQLEELLARLAPKRSLLSLLSGKKGARP